LILWPMRRAYHLDTSGIALQEAQTAHRLPMISLTEVATGTSCTSLH
jgi:hypothetical protein